MEANEISQFPRRPDLPLRMEGVGWEGDLNAMRANRFADWISSADS